MGNGRWEVWWQVQTPDSAPALPTPFSGGVQEGHLRGPEFSPSFNSYYIFPAESGLLRLLSLLLDKTLRAAHLCPPEGGLAHKLV